MGGIQDLFERARFFVDMHRRAVAAAALAVVVVVAAAVAFGGGSSSGPDGQAPRQAAAPTTTAKPGTSTPGHSSPGQFTLAPTGACKTQVDALEAYLADHRPTKTGVGAQVMAGYTHIYSQITKSCPADQVNAVVNTVVEPWLMAQNQSTPINATSPTTR